MQSNPRNKPLNLRILFTKAVMGLHMGCINDFIGMKKVSPLEVNQILKHRAFMVLGNMVASQNSAHRNNQAASSAYLKMKVQKKKGLLLAHTLD